MLDMMRILSIARPGGFFRLSQRNEFPAIGDPVQSGEQPSAHHDHSRYVAERIRSQNGIGCDSTWVNPSFSNGISEM
jgi:hypothetical protein